MLAAAALVRPRRRPADPVADLLRRLDGDPVPVVDLAGLWDMPPDDALDVASDAEAEGLVETIEDDDGTLLARLSPAGRVRAGLLPEGHQRIDYRDSSGRVLSLIVPDAIARALVTLDARQRRSELRWRALGLVTGVPDDPGELAPVVERVEDPGTPDPLDALAVAEETPAPPPGKRRTAVRRPAPRPSLVLGLGCRWDGPETPEALPCPGCGGAPLPVIGYCCRCDRSGAEHLLEAVSPSERPKSPDAPKPRPKPRRPARRKLDAPALDRAKPSKATRGYHHPSAGERRANAFDLASLKRSLENQL